MRILLVLALLTGPAALARAGLDPETKTPYQLRIVLHCVEHPDFTEHFCRELKRELQANLQAALGPLGAVEVIDLNAVERSRWEPLWKQVEEKGLQSLDSFHEIGGGKTHFLRIESNNGHYDLQARQVDGTCGFATPIVRKCRTHTRGFVSRLAGLMIGQDFGAVATFEPGAGQNAVVRVKAGALGPIDKWVKKGEVFAVIQVNRVVQRVPPPKGTKGPVKIVSSVSSARVDGVLLKVVAEPRDGAVSCQMFYRYEDPLPIKGVVGYRCVKLGTTEAPLRLQLIDPAGAPHKAAALQVYARGLDFPDNPKEAEQASLQDGVFVSREKFSNVAFVRVMLGNRRISRIPIEILDDRVQLCSIRLDPGAENRDRIDSERRGVLGRITDGRLIQVRCFQEITALEQANMKQQALDRGQSVLKTLDASASDLQEDIDKLRQRAAKEAPAMAAALGECQQQLQIMQGKQDELRRHLTALKAAIVEESDPAAAAKKQKVQDAVRRAELLVAQAEYDQALKAYEEALVAAQSDAARKAIDVPYQALKKDWALREGDLAHAEARRFIVEKWPKLGTPKEVGDELANARRAFEKCKEVGDRLAINKMHLASVEIVAKFRDELKKTIDSATEEEDKKTLEKYRQVNEELLKLLRDVEDSFLAKKK